MVNKTCLDLGLITLTFENLVQAVKSRYFEDNTNFRRCQNKMN